MLGFEVVPILLIGAGLAGFAVSRIFYLKRRHRGERRLRRARKTIHFLVGSEFYFTSPSLVSSTQDFSHVDFELEYLEKLRKILLLAVKAIRILCVHRKQSEQEVDINLYTIDRLTMQYRKVLWSDLSWHQDDSVCNDSEPGFELVFDSLLRGEPRKLVSMGDHQYFGVVVPSITFATEGERNAPASIEALIMVKTSKQVALKAELDFLEYWLVDFGRRLLMRVQFLEKCVAQNTGRAGRARHGLSGFSNVVRLPVQDGN